ncbi:ribonuclease H-like [Leptopilina heterotoma]|uniref:ribonuclease H-like n=1 Tax=Leptopilina heterotoma TaxID=63436 RepID=UPI001CA9F969|nr:ribonuclease H-like [Leptopilina heterotoma]
MPPKVIPMSPKLQPYNGACGDNGGTRPRAGIGVWFGPDHPLNVSRRYGGRQTNNASEIEAATVAIHQERTAGIRKIRIKTDSKVLVQGIKEWVPKWQKNNWKTNDNHPCIDLDKSVQKFEEFLAKRGVNPSNLTNQTLAWDHEGIDTTRRKPHVSEGESDEEYLELLKNVDPCQDYNDNDFGKRVNDFLRNYNQSRQKKRQEEVEQPVAEADAKSPRPEATTEVLPSSSTRPPSRCTVDSIHSQSRTRHPRFGKTNQGKKRKHYATPITIAKFQQ